MEVEMKEGEESHRKQVLRILRRKKCEVPICIELEHAACEYAQQGQVAVHHSQPSLRLGELRLLCGPYLGGGVHTPGAQANSSGSHRGNLQGGEGMCSGSARACPYYLDRERFHISGWRRIRRIRAFLEIVVGGEKTLSG